MLAFNEPDVIVEADSHALAARLAHDWVGAYRASIASHGHFNAVFAGGSTPKLFYETLSDPCFSNEISWDRVSVFFGDERAARPDHADSNYRMVEHHLLSRAPVPKTRVHRMEGERHDLGAAAAEYSSLIEQCLEHDGDGAPVFDLVLLGIGPDGHVASLFPGSPELDVTDRWVTVSQVPETGSKRMTITIPIMRSARRVWLLCCGERKADIVRTMLQDNAICGDDRIPAARTRPKDGQWRLYCDEAAASKISSANWNMISNTGCAGRREREKTD
jgi:6-phosphogluconolactonase